MYVHVWREKVIYGSLKQVIGMREGEFILQVDRERVETGRYLCFYIYRGK